MQKVKLQNRKSNSERFHGVREEEKTRQLREREINL